MRESPKNLRHRLILVRDLDRIGADDRELRRRRDSGDLIRVRRGSYLPRDQWDEMDGRERHIARAHAVAANATIDPVFSHFTAAALHGIPVIGPYPRHVHVTVAPGVNRRKQVDLTTHSLSVDNHEMTSVDGLTATTTTRTLIDLALTSTFQSAVASLDWGLANGVERSELHSELERLNPVKRMRAAALAIDFADAQSGSPGESLSRASMHLLGCVAPEIQVPIRDGRGTIGTVDFYWPDADLIGEFDGVSKYTRDEYLVGRSFVRWGWAEATDLEELARVLRAAGVPGLH